MIINVPVNKDLLTGTVPVNKELLTGTFRSIASSLFLVEVEFLVGGVGWVVWYEQQ